MPDYERAMLIYARLAAISQEKQQLAGRDKFLILTGAEACRAGWPEVAARCRELVHANNPAHLLNRFETFPSALRDEEFVIFLKQLERFCTHEKGEHLLSELEITPDVPPNYRDAGAGTFALDVLAGAA
jgi:hypothetical protein